MATPSFPTRHDLPAAARAELIALLNQALADLTDLHSQTKHAHWNVKGPTFIALHELFDDLAERREDEIDTVAERAVSLGGYARGTLRMSAAATRLAEFPAAVDGQAVVTALADRYAHVAAGVRAAIEESARHGDADTADLFTEVSRSLDKDLWFLEAHLVRAE